MSDTEALREKVIEVLESIIDPEIGIDVYNLGLIYDIQVIDDKNVKISMGLTTIFCPLASIIPLMISEQLRVRLGIEADISVVYDPPWTPLRMTEKGRSAFKERFGYDIVETYLQSFRLINK
ncbi:MAG: metal-sulfur cluster assembly factor [Desulfurococcaceae archaeon]